MRIRTTSTQRTYRYVRLALVAATVFLGIALAVESVAGGVPPSVSAAYYTPAGPVFVGSLSAVALALLALSGRSLEQGLLDVAAVLALVIAYVPTSVSSESCAPARRCIPAEFGPTVANNAGAVASLVVLGVVAALVLARRRALWARAWWRRPVSSRRRSWRGPCGRSPHPRRSRLSPTRSRPSRSSS